ncbi:uncharacterized protein [Prorops nasuta]|uniref:uncharacterized protein n=1 Tax=Prorops nasuta TaxID=863751 RepID=UPI0034CEE27C
MLVGMSKRDSLVKFAIVIIVNVVLCWAKSFDSTSNEDQSFSHITIINANASSDKNQDSLLNEGTHYNSMKEKVLTVFPKAYPVKSKLNQLKYSKNWNKKLDHNYLDQPVNRFESEKLSKVNPLLTLYSFNKYTNRISASSGLNTINDLNGRLKRDIDTVDTQDADKVMQDYYAKRNAVMEKYKERRKALFSKYANKSEGSTKMPTTALDVNTDSKNISAEVPQVSVTPLIIKLSPTSPTVNVTEILNPEFDLTNLSVKEHTYLVETLPDKERNSVNSLYEDDEFGPTRMYPVYNNLSRSIHPKDLRRFQGEDDNSFTIGNCNNNIIYEHDLALNLNHYNSNSSTGHSLLDVIFETTFDGVVCISCIKLNNYNSTEAKINLLEGGPNYKTVKLRLTGSQNKGIFYIIQITGIFENC